MNQPLKHDTHFENIDILRGFAALSVVIYHIIEIYPWPDFMPGTMAGLWFHIGWMGVDLFFVISGFVIALSAFKLLDNRAPRFTASFMRRRFARIVPLHYLTGLIFVMFCIPSLLFEPTRWLHAITHLTFTHNFLPNTHGSINGANWSLGTEMQFYLLIALIAPWLRRTPPLLILVSGLIVAWTWRAVCFWYLHRHAATVDGFKMFFISTQLPGMLDEFAMGVFLARIYVDDQEGKFKGFLSKFRWLLPLIAGGIIYLALHRFWQVANYWDNFWQVTFWRSSLALSCLLTLISACALSDSWFKTITRPLRYLGTISYGIYLWHLPIILALKTVPIGDPVRFSQYALVMILLFATLSWHFFEKPMQQRFSS